MKAILITFYWCSWLTSGFEQQAVDYYWKDFGGVVPYDAVQGGIDKAGNPSYVGQAFFPKHGILVVTIYENTKSACGSAYVGTICTEDYVKVLCTRNIENLKWVLVKNEETHLLTDCRLVIGGTESGYPLYIGRVRHDRETIMGKVFPNYVSYSALLAPYNKTSEVAYKTYDILTHKCNVSYRNLTVVDAYTPKDPSSNITLLRRNSLVVSQ